LGQRQLGGKNFKGARKEEVRRSADQVPATKKARGTRGRGRSEG